MNFDLILSRLNKKKKILTGGCWIIADWKGNAKRELCIDGNNYLIHRLSAAIYLGYNIYDNKNLICHKCRTKWCWNYEHIYIGTTSSNTRDSIIDGTFKNPNIDKTQCKYGHELSGYNLYTWRDRKTGHIHRWCRICRLSNTHKSRD